MLARFTRWFDLRPGEGLPVVFTFTYIALVVASFLLAKPVRNGLFLQQYGADNLASVYVAVPVVLLLFVPLYTRVIARRGHRRVISATLGFFAANALAFWYAFTYHPTPLLAAAFYVWVNCYAVIAPVQAWAFVASLFDTRQARRLFGLIGAGASFGAIMGGLMARVLVGPVGGAVNLMPVMAAFMLAAAAFVASSRRWTPRLGAGPADRRSRIPFRDTLEFIARTPYVRWVALLVVVVAMTTQWVGFQFSLAAEQRYGGDADRLTAFFGTFNFSLGLLALLLQLFVTGPVLRRFGLTMTILLLPVALGSASMLIVLVPELFAVLVAASSDQALRFSTDKATYELLYLPIGPAMRSNVKATIDIVVSRVADAVGGVLLGLATGGLGPLPGAGFGLRGTAALNMAFIAIWTALALGVRRGYFLAIQDSIRQHRLDAERATGLILDRSTAGFVEAKLTATDPEEILYALGFFEAESRDPHPAIRFLLDHEHPRVRRTALAVLRLAGDRTVAGKAAQMLADPDLETRTEALLYVTQHAGIDPLERIQQLGNFPDFSIQAGIIAFLSQPGPHENRDAVAAMLGAMISDRSASAVRARIEAARLLGLLPHVFSTELSSLVGDDYEAVAREAIRAVGRQRAWRCSDVVIERLKDAALAQDAIASLVALGDRAIGPLRARLTDQGAPAEIRYEIPGVLARIGTEAAHRALVAALLERDAQLRLRVVAALNKLHRADPALPLDRRMVETALAAEVIGHYRSYQVLHSLRSGLAGDDPMVAGLQQSMDREIERIFRLLQLLFADRDLESAYVGIRSANPAIRAHAVEFIDHILTSSELRRLLLPLLDSQVAVEERARLGARLLGASVGSHEAAVATLLVSDDPWLKACAVYAIGALGLTSMEAEVAHALGQADPLLRETARTAQRRLSGEPLPAARAAVEPADEWRRTEDLGMG